MKIQQSFLVSLVSIFYSTVVHLFANRSSSRDWCCSPIPLNNFLWIRHRPHSEVQQKTLNQHFLPLKSVIFLTGLLPLSDVLVFPSWQPETYPFVAAFFSISQPPGVSVFLFFTQCAPFFLTSSFCNEEVCSTCGSPPGFGPVESESGFLDHVPFPSPP